MDEISASTGFSYTLGYVSEKEEFGLASGPKQSPYIAEKVVNGTMSADDMMNLGSGTKGFVSTAVLKLVEAGKINLDDPIIQHTDGPMKEMWNTTLVEVLGERAANVTVHNLIFMQSGI
jgi:CubicO group peptidase (beta-lactamase class C family)